MGSAHGWLYAFDLLGTFIFALSGALAAFDKKMDIFGMLILAIVTGSGGGVLRSIFIGDLPLPFLKDPTYLLTELLATLVVFYGRELFKKDGRTFLTLDALGLSIFLSIGVTVALNHHLTSWASILMGVITACFGGVIRDVLSTEVPLIFQKELYASSAFLGGVIYIFLFYLGLASVYTILISSVIVFSARELSLHYDLSLPTPP